VVSAWKVVCPKEICGAQGLRNYSCHHLAATAALPELFCAAKHFCIKNADGELSYKYKDIQSKCVGNLDKLKFFRKRMDAFNMFDPFLIPVWIDPHTFSVMELWGNRKSNAIDLTKPWSKVTGRETLLIGALMTMIHLVWSGLRNCPPTLAILIL
jgi:hypothetical protein